jgi:phosphatidate cytidylyltransferase
MARLTRALPRDKADAAAVPQLMTRVASAIVLGALLLVTIWWLPWWATAALAAIAAVLAAIEVAGIASATGARVEAGPVGAAAAALVIAFAWPSDTGVDVVLPVLLAILIGTGLLALAGGSPSPQTLTRAAVMMMAPLYVGLPLGALASIAHANGPGSVTWMIVLIAASDSAQYYTGRALGRRMLAPAISPAKTVEGAIGGLVAAAIVAPLAGRWCLPGKSVATLAILGLLLAAFGMAGDLFESLLKRSAGVKDSSNIIPGHGGVLDRIDSYLFAAPVFYVFLRYVA